MSKKVAAIDLIRQGGSGEPPYLQRMLRTCITLERKMYARAYIGTARTECSPYLGGLACHRLEFLDSGVEIVNAANHETAFSCFIALEPLAFHVFAGNLGAIL